MSEKFGEQYLTFLDPDGLKFELTGPQQPDNRKPWLTGEITDAQAIRGTDDVSARLGELVAEIASEVRARAAAREELSGILSR